MSDIIQHSKKVLSAALTVTTIVWSIGLFAFVAPVEAAAGDLVKAASGPAVYLVDADGVTIHPFPHANVYTSWGYPADFSSTFTTDLSGFTVGNDVEFRDGSLVRALETPAVYAKSSGELRPVVSAEVFETLGYNYDNITWLPQSFLDKYATGGTVESTTVHLNGTVVKYAGSSTLYLIEGGMKRQFATSEVAAVNGYAAIPVITIPSSETYSDGAKIVVKESVLTVPTGVGAVPTDTTPPGDGPVAVGSGLSVSLASDTPVVATILSDSTASTYPQALIPVTKLNLTAGSDGAVKVTSLSFKRNGVASDSDIGNLYLYDGDTRLAEYASFNEKVVTFTDSSGLVMVGAGSSKAVTLKIDLARGSTSVAAGKTIGFNLVAASDVTTDGAAVSGSFPMVGNLMSTAAVADLGHVYLSSYTTFPASIEANATGQELWRFTATADSQDMDIRYLRMTMVGTISNTDVKDLKLEVGGVQIGTTQQLGSDNKLVFDLASAPYEITAGQSKVFILRGDIGGGSSKSFKFTIQKQADIVAYDTNYEVFNSVAITNVTTAFALIEPETGNGTDINTGTITTSVASDSPTGNVADGASNVLLAKFGFEAAGEDVKVETLDISVAITDNSADTAAIGLVNVKALLEGSQIGTTDAAMSTSTAGTFNFGNTFRVPAGTTKYLTVLADLTNSSLAASDTIIVTIDAGSSNAQTLTTLTSRSTTAQSARTLTVKSGSISVTENTAFADRSTSLPTATKTASDIKIGSFIITAGSGEASDVTQIVMLDGSTTSQMVDNYTAIRLKNGSNQIGSVAQTSGTTDGTAAQFTFTPSSAIRINAGAQYIVDVYADVKSSPADSGTAASIWDPVIKVDSVTATGVSTSSDVSYSGDLSIQKAYISANGNLTVTKGADAPIAQQLVMGSTAQEVAEFKIAASVDEDVTISELYVAATVSTGATGTFSNITLWNGSTQVGSAAGFGTTSTTTYAVAPFPNLDLTIPANGNVILTVKADVSVNGNASSADTATFALLPDYDGSSAGFQEAVVAKGLSSGATIATTDIDFNGLTSDNDATTSGNEMTVYGTKLTAAWASDTPTGASTPQASQTVAKFVLTNASNVGNYAATVRYLNFAISTQGASKAINTRIDLNVYKDAVNSGNLVGTTSWAASDDNDLGDTAMANTASTLAEGTTFGFTATEIAAGASKTFLVQLDTNETGFAVTESLSINMAASDIAWRDGVGTSDITTVNSLPLTSKTLTY
jgi:hypothetical protein